MTAQPKNSGSYCHHGGRNKTALIDKFNALVPATEIGYDRERDREGYAVAGDGITIIPRAAEKTCWTTIER